MTTETIGYDGCAGTAKLLVHLKGESPATCVEPATEWDLWRAGYVRIDRVAAVIEQAASKAGVTVDGPTAITLDFLSEGPDAPSLSPEANND